MYKIKQDRKKCIGCGSCAAICPDNWQMDDDGKTSPNEVAVEKLGCNQEAEKNCPVGCIQINQVDSKTNSNICLK